MVARWYVAQVKPRCEGWVVKNAVGAGFACFWPRYELKRKVGSGSCYFKGVFPGYMFVRFDNHDGHWRKVCHLYGIKRILGATDDGATPLPHGFVESMMTVAADGIIEMPKENVAVFNAGDELRITEGPLAGHVGVLKYSEKGRVALLLTLLGGQNQVILPSDKVVYAGASL